MRDLLNLSLDELRQLVEAEEARAALRRAVRLDRVRRGAAAHPRGRAAARRHAARARAAAQAGAGAARGGARRQAQAHRSRAGASSHLTASPLPASTAPTRARKRPRARNSALEREPLVGRQRDQQAARGLRVVAEREQLLRDTVGLDAARTPGCAGRRRCARRRAQLRARRPAPERRRSRCARRSAPPSRARDRRGRSP